MMVQELRGAITLPLYIFPITSLVIIGLGLELGIFR